MLWTVIDDGNPLQAFDCSHQDTAFRPVKMSGPGQCPDVKSDYDAAVEQPMQVLQVIEDVTLIGSFRCKIVVTKELSGCGGIRNTVYGSRYPLWEQVLQVPPEDCKKAYTSHKFHYEGRDLDVHIGTSVKYQFYSHGAVTSDGYCKVADIVESEGVTYTNSFQHIRMTILVEDVKGTYNLIERSVTFPVFSVTGRYDDKIIHDWEHGTIIWPENKEACEKGVSVVYRGPAWVHKKTALLGEYRDAIILINSTQTNQYAGLVVKVHSPYCGMSCYRTHITGLSICPWTQQSGGSKMLTDDLFKASADTARVDIQTQMAHMHFTTNMAVYDAFRQVQRAMCITDRKTLSNKLQAIAGDSTPYALMDLYGSGHTSFIAGGVAYIAKCVPVEVTREEFGNCTQEIPVTYRTELMFVNAITRIIQQHPTIIPCSDLMQVMWELDEGWFCSGPQIRKCEAPLTLEPLSPSKMDVDFTMGMGRGIYTEEQLRAHRRFDHSMSNRAPVLAKIANQVAMNGDSAKGHIGTILGMDDLSLVERVLTPRWFPGFHYLGQFWSWITSLGIIIIVVRLFFGFFARLYAIYRRRGPGLWLLGAISDTTFMIVLIPVTIFDAIYEGIIEPWTKADNGWMDGYIFDRIHTFQCNDMNGTATYID